MPNTYFPATGKNKASYSHRDAKERPIVFVGGVTILDTKDRPNPPDPICGMKLGKTSLGNGHIMALQLGGPDVPENIVPQYQQWQQSGRWRVLEKAAMAHAAVGSWIFVAQMHYGHTHKSGKDHAAEFLKGNTTIFWDDPRIPTIFDIWLVPGGSDEGKAILTNILDPKAKDGDREKAAAALPLALAAKHHFRKNDDQATEMPEEDRNYWRKNELATIVANMFEAYPEDREDQLKTAAKLVKDHGIGDKGEREDMMDVLMSPKRETEYEFVAGYGDEIREQLDLEGWAPSEITQYGTNSHMLEAVFHKPKLTAAMLKSQTKRLEAYDSLHDGSVKRRGKYATRHEPYKRMTETFERGYKGDQLKDTAEKYKKRLQRFENSMVV